MTESQQLLMTALSIMVTVLIGILINNSRLNDLNVRIGELRAHMDHRFDDTRDMWRTELHRVEEILDARLKHIEERR